MTLDKLFNPGNCNHDAMHFIGDQQSTKKHGYLPLANCYQDARSENNLGCQSTFFPDPATYFKETIFDQVYYTKKIQPPSGDMYQMEE